MKITLEKTGRRFNKEWIFRNVDAEFASGNRIAVVGGNGSGKSTFLQLISGFLVPSEGKINYTYQNRTIQNENVFRHLALCSPFQELYEDYTAGEMFLFHSRLKKMKNDIGEKEFLETLELQNIKNKALRNFSSGMKQRVKLALAILSDTPVLLLDEPCSNLDRNAIDWYKKLLTEYSGKRLLMVSSNKNEDEMFLCQDYFDVEHFK